MTPDTAMFFAAGHGTRMRELTRDRPKPMIPLGGVPLIDRALDWADGAGIQNRVVNVHYLGEMLADHLKNRPGLQISEEPAQALETGGGLKQALPLLGRDPVYTLNPDALWTGANPFTQLAAYWRPEDMDALLLLVPVTSALGHSSGGDFTMSDRGNLRRAVKTDPLAYVYTGAQIIATGGLGSIRQDVFSLNLLWDRMMANDRLFGCVYPGDWVSVGTPESLALAEAHLRRISDV